MLSLWRDRVDRLLTWKRASTYALVLIVLYVVAWISVVGTGTPPLNNSDVPIGGDYIAFHTAGRLLLMGEATHLYDHAAVSGVQAELLGGRVPGFYDAYRNPPFFALPFAPLAFLDLLPGLAVYSLVSFACLAGALWLLLAEVPWLRSRWRGLLVLVFAFPPVYFGLIDGENATLSLLLYVLIYRALARDQDGWAGAWAALGLFKPQLFFVFPLVFLASRRWRALASYTLVAMMLALVSFGTVGADGMQAWLRILVEPESGNATANAWRMVSLKSFFATLVPGEGPLAWGLYLATSLLMLSGLVTLWAHRRGARDQVWMFTVLTAVLVNPHLVDYDLTVLVAAAPVCIARLPRYVTWLVVALYLLLLWRAQIDFGGSGIQLSTLALAAIAATTWLALHRSTERGRILLPTVDGGITAHEELIWQ